MHFDHRFQVSGTPQAVALQFADVPLMAGFLPGASVAPPDENGSYPATLVASFGPKRIAFKGTLTSQVDREALSGVIVGQASADVRGARMAVTMTYRLMPAGAAMTEVRLESDAQLTGVLAEFAKAGGTIVAEALIAEFARRFSAHMEALQAGEAPAAPQGEATLSLWTLVSAMLQRFRLWIRRQSA